VKSEKNRKDNEMNDKEISSLKKIIKDAARESMNEMNDTRVPIYFVANRIQKDEELVRKLFKEIISDQDYYGKFDLDGDYIVYKIAEEKCYDCGAILEKFDKKCKACGIEFDMCFVCKKLIKEIPVFCPKCNSPFHKRHLIKWIHMNIDKTTGKGPCPKCSKPLEVSDIKEYDVFKSYF